MRFANLCFRSLPLVCAAGLAAAGTAPPPKWDTCADTWVATDGLGRTLPDHAAVGSPKGDRTVGIFYFLWHEGQNEVHDLTNPMAVVEQFAGAPYRWTTLTKIPCRIAGSQLELAIPRATLGLAPGKTTLDFKWADGIRQTGDWSDFTLHGDAAPNDRFNFRAVIP